MTRNEKRVQSHEIQEIKRQCKIKIQRRQNQSMDTLKDQHNQDLEALIEGRKKRPTRKSQVQFDRIPKELKKEVPEERQC